MRQKGGWRFFYASARSGYYYWLVPTRSKQCNHGCARRARRFYHADRGRGTTYSRAWSCAHWRDRDRPTRWQHLARATFRRLSPTQWEWRTDGTGVGERIRHAHVSDWPDEYSQRRSRARRSGSQRYRQPRAGRSLLVGAPGRWRDIRWIAERH